VEEGAGELELVDRPRQELAPEPLGGQEADGRQGGNMAKVAPFHSKKKSDRNVYHDNSSCTEGNNIEPQNKVSGTGGRPKCEHCQRLG